MVKKTLTEWRGDTEISRSIEIVNNPADLSAASSQLSRQILESLAEEPSYPNELARRLDVHEQKVYYHVRRLLDVGMLEVVDEVTVRGASANILAPTADAFGFELSSAGREVTREGHTFSPELKEFFHEFIRTGTFEGSVVVGAPNPHGPYDTEARDGHYPAHLTMFLGELCAVPRDRFIVKLDTEVNAEDAHSRNMVLVGGPITNNVVSDLMDSMDVSMKYDDGWVIHSGLSGETYDDPRDAMIAKIPNPWDEDKTCIVLAGTSRNATKTCIIALTQHHESVLDGFDKNMSFYKVIRGLDKDGDGKVDDIEILE